MTRDIYGNTTDRNDYLRTLPEGWYLEDEPLGAAMAIVRWSIVGFVFWLLMWWIATSMGG